MRFAVKDKHSPKLRSEFVWFTTCDSNVPPRHEFAGLVASLDRNHPTRSYPVFVFVLLWNSHYLHSRVIHLDDDLFSGGLRLGTAATDSCKHRCSKFKLRYGTHTRRRDPRTNRMNWLTSEVILQLANANCLACTIKIIAIELS